MSALLPGNDPSAIQAAAQRLADGELLGLPTETVYGLAARADQDEAVARIFAAKGRPADNPVIVHAPDAPTAWRVTAGPTPLAERLAALIADGRLHRLERVEDLVIAPRGPAAAPTRCRTFPSMPATALPLPPAPWAPSCRPPPAWT
mgnify:CR=1 FL=1